VFDKDGIGFKLVYQKKKKKKKTRKFSIFSNHNKKQASPFQSYFFCLQKGHSSGHVELDCLIFQMAW